MDHMEGTVPVFESKIAANARVHARTHATPYRIPSICSLRCPSATCVQTSAQCVPYRNHEHRCTPFAARSTSPLHSRGSPKEGEQNQKSKPTLGVTMMPLGAPSITKYGSLVRPDRQIVALRAHRTRTALKAPPRCGSFRSRLGSRLSRELQPLWQAVWLRNITSEEQFLGGKNVCQPPYSTRTLCPHNLSA